MANLEFNGNYKFKGKNNKLPIFKDVYNSSIDKACIYISADYGYGYRTKNEWHKGVDLIPHKSEGNRADEKDFNVYNPFGGKTVSIYNYDGNTKDTLANTASNIPPLS